MDWNTFFVLLVNGLTLGSVYALIALGYTMVYGILKLLNFAHGEIYMFGAFAGYGILSVAGAPGTPGIPFNPGIPIALLIILMFGAGMAVSSLLGVVVERVLLRFVYDRDETFQLLMTFAIVLMMEDAIRLTWGTAPRSTAGLYLTYGQLSLFGAVAPVYNLIVIAASLAIALAIGWLFTRTAFGRIIRATADNREMAEALGVDMRRVYAKVFTLGTALGTLGGALVIPATAAMSEMGIELIVEAFAVVVIGGLGSMRGAFVGALVVGILRAIAISVYPELEMLLIYLIVIAVLVARPRGLFGGAAA